MRVYIPATLALLSEWVSAGSVQARSGTVFAVTPALREAYADGDDEVLGEVALSEAALASLRLLAAEDNPRLRRAVLEVDADPAEVTLRPDLDDAVARLSGPVGLDRVVAAYVDNAAAEPAVAAAIDVIDEADMGDEDAELTVGDAQDHDLAWYGAQELAFLPELL